jgi:hypothetical protein
VRPSDKLGGPRPSGSIQPRKWPAARERDALAARLPHAVHACDGAVAHSSVARWWLAGGKVLSVSSWGHGEGVRQGGRGQSSPERRCGVEVVEKSRDNGVHRWGESSGGQW